MQAWQLKAPPDTVHSDLFPRKSFLSPLLLLQIESWCRRTLCRCWLLLLLLLLLLFLLKDASGSWRITLKKLHPQSFLASWRLLQRRRLDLAIEVRRVVRDKEKVEDFGWRARGRRFQGLTEKREGGWVLKGFSKVVKRFKKSSQ